MLESVYQVRLDQRILFQPDFNLRQGATGDVGGLKDWGPLDGPRLVSQVWLFALLLKTGTPQGLASIGRTTL